MTKEALLEQNETLKDAYIKLLNDKDVLTQWAKPQLETLYLAKIGAYELQILNLKLQVKALKRKIELVHQYINRDEKVDFIDIELKVGVELAHAQKQINEQAAAIEQAHFLLCHLHTPEHSAQLRKLYKILAKQLHPDVNPNITEEQLAIWYKIKDAYETGNLERLKALSIVYENEIKPITQEEVDIDHLALQNAALKQGVLLLENEIEGLKKQFPFTVEKQIKDEEWVTQKQETLTQEVEALKEYQLQLEAELNTLRNLYGNE